MNHLVISTALAIALAVPAAYAQTTQAPPQQTPTMNQSPSGAAGVGAVQQQPGDFMVDDIIGTSVRNQQNEDIGSVTDLLIDRNGQVKAAVLSVGGFLGIGDKDVAVPWNQVQVRADPSTYSGTTTTGSAAAEREPILSVNITKDQLEQAPAFQTIGQQSRGSRGTGPSGSGSSTMPPAGTTSPAR